MLVSLSSLVCTLWQKIKIRINTDFSVTGWMLCVITHVSKDAKDHSNSYHVKQVNIVIKTLFHGLSEEKKWLILKTYSLLSILTSITRMVYMMGMNLYGKANTSEMVTVICGIQNILFLAPRFLVFVACRVTSKFIVIGAADHSLSDVKTIKYGKGYSIRRDVSEK